MGARSSKRGLAGGGEAGDGGGGTRGGAWYAGGRAAAAGRPCGACLRTYARHNGRDQAGISSTRGRNPAGKARVRGLGAGAHLLRRPQMALPSPIGQVAGGRRPPTQRRRSRLLPLSRSSPEPGGQKRPTGTGPSTCPLHRIGGGVADGAGAHLHRMKAGVDPVLSTCWCDVCAPRWQCRVGMRARQLVR